MDFTKPHPLLATPGKKLFPVVHIKDKDQTLINVRVALNNDADGVFLINHDHPPAEVMFVYEYVRKHMPDVFIGVNFLGWSAAQAFEAARHYDDISALWVDHPGWIVGENSDGAMHLFGNMLSTNWPGAYFASVAFKGQQPITVEHLPLVISNAYSICHTIVTSGDETGFAPPQEKLRIMHDALARAPDNIRLLANASGTDLSNVKVLGPHADIFMVATGINQDDDFYNLDPARVKAMANILHSM